jgi:NADPH-dependent 2,4-dienoyl-CoA reductase/sulfur reductase-like enzyme
VATLNKLGQSIWYGLLGFFTDLFSDCERICEAEGGLRFGYLEGWGQGMRRLKRRSFLKLGAGAMASFFLPRVGGAAGSTDCIIIGAGIAGLVAGDYLRRKG